jgi:hypothetical protein
MTGRFVRYSVIAVLAIVAALVFAPPAAAQGNTPRMPDGKPDLTGWWGGGGGDDGPREPEEGNLTVLNRSRGCHPGMKICTGPVNQSNDSTFTARFNPNRPLYKPEYWAKVRELDLNSNTVAPYFICQSRGVPAIGTPTRIFQTATDITLLYGNGDFRIVPIDGRPHDKVKSLDLLFHGHTVGRWEGDTLVLDSVAFNDLTWIGNSGYFHSDQMRVLEKFTRNGNRIDYQATVIDPEVLIEPWVRDPVVMNLNTNTKNAEIGERLPCEERDQQHMVGLIHH